jgi:hypothetical protein
MLMLASPSSSPRHRGSIERGVDGGDHRVIGGLATEMCGDRVQEMIALSDRQRRRRRHAQRMPQRGASDSEASFRWSWSCWLAAMLLRPFVA